MTGSSTQGIRTVLHPVSDLEKAKPVYAALLGVQPQNDLSYYVDFDAAGQHIGLVPGGGPQGMTAPVAYWHVADIGPSWRRWPPRVRQSKNPRTTSVAVAWWRRSPIPTATSSA